MGKEKKNMILTNCMTRHMFYHILHGYPSPDLDKYINKLGFLFGVGGGGGGLIFLHTLYISISVLPL